jgi:hypothetical protein
MKTRSALWQLYLLGVCLLCLLVLGVAGAAALLGSVRMHYPQVSLPDDQWARARSFEHFVATRPQPASTMGDEELRAAWQRYRHLVIGRERRLGKRQVVRWAIVMVVAFAIFLPHLWAARRLAREEREAAKPPD